MDATWFAAYLRIDGPSQQAMMIGWKADQPEH
jgi:hypothetical protein